MALVKYNNNSVSDITSAASATGGAMTLISTTTASSSSTVSITSGILHLFEPSSTTFVKHFISRFNYNHYQDYQIDIYVAGYFDTTSAINAIQFKFDSGNIDNGVIKLYGVS